MEVWSRKRLPFGIPLSARSRLQGLAGARRQLALLLRLPPQQANSGPVGGPGLHRPTGYGFRSKSVCKVQRKISPEPP